MRILAIESSTDVCSVSILDEQELLEIRETTESRIHSEKLPLFIDELISIYSPVSAIAVSIGPGSYTGLRIGVSLAKGLAHALNIPVIPIPTLHGIESAVPFGFGRHYVALHSHKNLIFYQLFENGEALYKAVCEDIDKLNPDIPVFGWGLNRIPGCNIQYNEVKPSSKYIGVLASARFGDRKTMNLGEITPVYITNFKLDKYDRSGKK